MFLMKTFRFSKGGQHYVFRAETPSNANDLIGEINGLANDSECNLDFLDAETLSFQVRQHYDGRV